jgi:hypothetical protein
MPLVTSRRAWRSGQTQVWISRPLRAGFLFSKIIAEAAAATIRLAGSALLAMVGVVKS